ncbi:hypothetical protein ACG33_06785 [Steroidobacter denitrificans]|uniref:DNA repair protein RecN n=1 Tax=Steroidobacter denitrificans TaxID=465721 RepID=A0A127FB25_STEDE|nr:DNA repair protein RecN [Steroidobacter denitrificans]AMN46808.1 hypothetical protein ACG33_06785 [Steroidobacter denitrificans]
MLVHIQIRDFAIIDAVELGLGPGLTVLTGETGAGKSILVDALLLASGMRAGTEVIRHGASRAEVSATFTIHGNEAASAWLAEQAIDHDGECVLRRVVSADGRSRAYINGQTMPLQTLRQLAEVLLDVHGQMEFQSLVRRAAQRELLDQSADHRQLQNLVAQCWRARSALLEERERCAATAQGRETRLELLRHHLHELEVMEPKPGEIEALSEERRRLSQHGRLASGAREIMLLLREAEDFNAEQALARALHLARGLAQLDGRCEPMPGLMEESLICLREGIDTVAHYESNLDADPQRLEWLEQRLAALESIARKHRVEPGELPLLRLRLEEEHRQLEALEISLERLDQRLETAQRAFQEACERLSAARVAAARRLSRQITVLMQTLGMPGGELRIDVRPLPTEAQGLHGADDIEFLVSANPGQPPKSLAKVASGGELSRISLAIQVAAVQNDALPCLVFDEVDAGIGGGVAEIVGRQLRALGERAQVLCVTHLPQVASQGHAHVRVTKLIDGKSTRTALRLLDAEERVEEIARMLGGIDITEKARAHAAEMLRPGSPKKAKTGNAKKTRL